MILGIVTAIIVILSCCMFFTKRSKNRNFQNCNHLVHKIAGFIALILSIIHLIGVWKLRFQRPVGMYVLGIIMTVMIVVLIISYYLRNIIGKKWRLIHKIMACSILICTAGHIFLGIDSLQVYKNKVNNITINSVNLEDISDGEYFGEENVGYIYCKVKVEVKNNKLISVDILEHRTEKGKPAENITDTMVKNQSNKVDAVSGATNSSKVIMKAVENALQNNIKH